MDRKDTYIIAITAEIRSQRMYQAMAKSFKKPENSAIFQQLVLMEKTHEEKLRKAFEKEFPGDELQIDVPLDKCFKGLDLSDPVVLIQFAIEREEVSHYHYQSLAKDCKDPQIREMLLLFAQEELQHKELLLDQEQSLQGAMTWYDPSELTGFMED